MFYVVIDKSNKMRKILFVGMYPNAEDKYKNVFFRNLIFAMADMGVECTIISPVSYMHYGKRIKNIPKFVDETTPSGNVVHTYYPRIMSASSKQIGYYNTEHLSERLFEKGALILAKALIKKGHEFDAIYGHFFLYGGLAAIRIGRKLKAPAYVAFGECDYESQIQQTYGDLTKRDIDGLSGVISVSTKNANRLKELGIFSDIPIIIAPNSVDRELFHPLDRSECRSKLGLPKDKFIVSFVGGFIERKGDKRLLAAVNDLDDVYLAYAGKGAEKPSGDNVLFCKPLDHDDIPTFLCASDVFCLPTLSEGSCNAVVEAMSCGVPVVSSNLSFNDDVLTDENAIRIDPSSVDEIKEALSKLKEDSSLRDKLSAAGVKSSETLDIKKRGEIILNFMFDGMWRNSRDLQSK